MQILTEGGALEHYNRLRDELTRLQAEVEALRQRLAAAERIESTKAQLDIERATIAKALKDDIFERREIIKNATLTFESLSQALYERQGVLTIADSPNGPVFEVTIDSQRSKGINNMQIFCFDLMLAELGANGRKNPGFLIHDSHLFDGVDERQVARALQLGARRAADKGFQYIVTLNSDALPKEGFDANFKITDHKQPAVYIADTSAHAIGQIHERRQDHLDQRNHATEDANQCGHRLPITASGRPGGATRPLPP